MQVGIWLSTTRSLELTRHQLLFLTGLKGLWLVSWWGSLLVFVGGGSIVDDLVVARAAPTLLPVFLCPSSPLAICLVCERLCES